MTDGADGGRVTRGRRPARSLVRLGAAVVAVTALLPVHALAASLSTATRSLGDGTATVPRCDTDGMKVLLNFGTTPTTLSSFVTATVSQIDAVCTGGVLSLTVNNGTATSTGSATVNATTMQITLASAIIPTDATQADLAIAGP